MEERKDKEVKGILIEVIGEREREREREREKERVMDLIWCLSDSFNNGKRERETYVQLINLCVSKNSHVI